MNIFAESKSEKKKKNKCLYYELSLKKEFRGCLSKEIPQKAENAPEQATLPSDQS